MATQTIQFAFLTGQTPTVKLFADDGSDTVLATPTATEATNRTGVYTFTQTDRAAGNYLITVSATGVNAEYSLPLTLPASTGTYWAVERANVTHISGDAAAADNLETACDGGSYNLGGGGVVAASVTGNVGGTVATVTTLTNLPSIPANWLTAAGIASGALNSKGDWLDTTTDRTQLSAIHGKLPTRAYLCGSTVNSGAIDATDRAAIADEVWDDTTEEHTGAGTFGLALQSAATSTALAALTGDQFTAIPWNAAWDAEVQSEVADAIVAAGLPRSGVTLRYTQVASNSANKTADVSIGAAS